MEEEEEDDDNEAEEEEEEEQEGGVGSAWQDVFLSVVYRVAPSTPFTTVIPLAST